MEQYKIGIEIELLINYISFKSNKLLDIVDLINKVLKEDNKDIEFKYLYPTIKNDYSKWVIVEDNTIISKNDNEIGFEIVSPILSLNKVLEIHKVLSSIKKLPIIINNTCGFHVHVSKSYKLELNNIKNIIKNYIIFENVIDLFHDKSRINNFYCKSISENNNFKYLKSISRKINRINHIKSLNDLINLINEDSKCFKVNLNSLITKGTIEFRQHISTINIDDIFNWIFFITLFVDMSYKYFDSNLITLSKLNYFNQFNYLFDNLIYNNDLKIFYYKKLKNNIGMIYNN